MLAVQTILEQLQCMTDTPSSSFSKTSWIGRKFYYMLSKRIGKGLSLMQSNHYTKFLFYRGEKGFEPLNVGSKFRCLTTWLHPNDAG